MADQRVGLVVGLSRTVGAVVGESLTARTIGSGGLEVLATPAMIALMEQAAYECLHQTLEPGLTSVGTKVAIRHLAASLVGATVSATATIVSVTGNQIEFAVSAREGDHLIGEGQHTRVIVDPESFVLKAKRA
ncbi:MAG: thioesterase family protein [Propionibacteriaceae bacterium]|jgi:predicted thioesterase|nr:thioesterase family protein [Propionibacteriaceae bacterium]